MSSYDDCGPNGEEGRHQHMTWRQQHTRTHTHTPTEAETAHPTAANSNKNGTGAGTTLSGDIFRVGMFLDIAWLTTRTMHPRGAYVRGANEIELTAIGVKLTAPAPAPATATATPQATAPPPLGVATA